MTDNLTKSMGTCHDIIDHRLMTGGHMSLTGDDTLSIDSRQTSQSKLDHVVNDGNI